jgi:hypothetical protein
MGENGHACYGIWREIQETEAIRVHDVVEEIRKWRAKPAVEISGEEGEFIWTSWSGSWERDGSVVGLRLPSPHVLVLSRQVALVERRGEDDVLLPQLHHVNLLRLRLQFVGLRHLALAHFGRHSSNNGGGD